jgi:adenosylhomocysteine nucleosidase
MPKVAIIAALEREVLPTVKKWQRTERECDGRMFRFYENDRAVLVCGGIGMGPARRACEAAIRLYHPGMAISVGFAGSLSPKLRVGDYLAPARVINVSDGTSIETGVGAGVLVSFDSIATIAQKAKLARAYAAEAVDMEAAGVARAAENHGIPFTAFKAISDGHDFEFPALENFIATDGSFRTSDFVVGSLLRPGHWGKAVAMARNSARASKTICSWLEQFNHVSGSPIGIRASAAF